MHSSIKHILRSSSRWGVCLSACWDTPPPLGVGLETPPGVGLDTPPGVGLETSLAKPHCKACWDTTPLWTDRHL